MLHLGDALDFSDSCQDEALEATAKDKNIIINDLSNEKLQFTSYQITKLVRQAANELFSEIELIKNSQNNELNLDNSPQTIAVVLPRYSSSIIFVFLAISGLSHIAMLMPDKLPKSEYVKSFSNTNCSICICDKEQTGAINAANTLNMRILSFSWFFDSFENSYYNELNMPRIVISECRTNPAQLHPKLAINPREYDVCLKVYSVRERITELSHRNIVVSVANMLKTYNFISYDDNQFYIADVSYCVVPLFHVHGLLCSSITPIIGRSSVVIAPYGFECSKFWQDIQLHRITWTSCTPSMIQELIDDYDESLINTKTLKFIRTSTANLSAELTVIAEKLLKIPILQAYSLTTCTHQVASNGYPTLQNRLAGSVGIPTGVEIAVIDENNNVVPCNEIGNIAVRGYTVIDPTIEHTKNRFNRKFLNHGKINWTVDKEKKASYYSSVLNLVDTNNTVLNSNDVINDNDISIQLNNSGTLCYATTIDIKNSELINDTASGISKESSNISVFPNEKDYKRLSLVPEGSTVLNPQIDYLGPSDTENTRHKTPGQNLLNTTNVAQNTAFMNLPRLASKLGAYNKENFPARRDPIYTILPPSMLWLITTDRGFIDNNGYLHIISNEETVTDIRGQKVNSEEVEYALLHNANIKECCVLGVRIKPSKWDLLALIVLNDGVTIDEKEFEEQVKSELAETLASFKIPTIFKYVKTLQRFDNGALDRTYMYNEYKNSFIKRGISRFFGLLS